jgi:CRP-like cAMP-binding protein
MDSLKPLLAEHPFFAGLGDHVIDLIVGCASNARFDAGEFLIREGEEANQFYMIRHGRVAVEIVSPERGPIQIETLGPGEILGWSWLIPPYYWVFDARAVELTRAIALDGRCLRTKCEEDHDVGYQLLKRFSYIVGQRLESTRLQLLDVYGIRTS